MYPEVKRLAAHTGRHRFARDRVLVPDDLYLIYWNRFHDDLLRLINAIILRCFADDFSHRKESFPYPYTRAAPHTILNLLFPLGK